MAKEKDTTRALTGSRLMNLPVPSTILTETESGSNLYAATNGWETLGNDVLYYENYFDLSAYELDDLTLVPTAIALQDGMPYFAINPAEELQVAIFDVVSQERLSMQEVFDNYIGTNGYPGSPGSTQDWKQLLMCNFRLLTIQNDFQAVTLLLPATGGSFGSSEPTAVQKLWVYRIVIPVANDLTDLTITIPPSRFVLGAEIVKEDDLPYMMRLKRSYELATQG